MELGIEGKVAVVAAGSRGLGFATAQALAAEGVNLVVSARGNDGLESAASLLRGFGVEVAIVVADNSDPEVPARLVATAVEQFGGLDIVVVNVT